MPPPSTGVRKSQPVAIVTGASAGIGFEAARKLAGKGFTVYAGARRVVRMAPLREAGVEVVELDVTDEQSMRAAVGRVLAERGRVDVLVNNAGYGSYGALEEVDPGEGRRQFDVNVVGLARMTQLVLPAMRQAGRGRIINVSSIGGMFYEPLGAWYHATKFAVEGTSASTGRPATSTPRAVIAEAILHAATSVHPKTRYRWAGERAPSPPCGGSCRTASMTWLSWRC